MTDSQSQLVDLTPADADRIVELERRAFIPVLQVARETVLARFILGHQMLGIEQGDRLVAMASFAYCRIDPEDFGTLPKTLKELCLQPKPDKFDSALMYNLEVEPNSRGRWHAHTLFRTALERAVADGCRHGFANSRIPSYAGSDPRYPQERVAHQPEVRAAIDAYLAGGQFPSDEVLKSDPLLAIYYRFTKCKFLWIVPHFAPDDIATGGIRMIMYSDLTA
jgi:ribosomal protein S18 acetylase RimI-like enzyme